MSRYWPSSSNAVEPSTTMTTQPSPHSYTRASGEGWVVIVVDGSTAFDDEGQSRLTVQLTNCRVPGCEC